MFPFENSTLLKTHMLIGLTRDLHLVHLLAEIRVNPLTLTKNISKQGIQI